VAEFCNWSKKHLIGLALNGVNPFGDLNSYHFTWPIVLLNYKLSFWLAIKHYFMMLALIIHGKEHVTPRNIHVYLEPIIEKLQIMWNGVKAYDSLKGNTQLEGYVYAEYTRLSNLWIVCKVCYQRSCGMPILWPNYRSSFFKEIEKMIYCGSWHYLPRTHPYRQAQIFFNGEIKNKVAPMWATTSKYHKMGQGIGNMVTRSME
jgi:hypothetical protein